MKSNQCAWPLVSFLICVAIVCSIAIALSRAHLKIDGLKQLRLPSTQKTTERAPRCRGDIPASLRKPTRNEFSGHRTTRSPNALPTKGLWLEFYPWRDEPMVVVLMIRDNSCERPDDDWDAVCVLTTEYFGGNVMYCPIEAGEELEVQLKEFNPFGGTEALPNYPSGTWKIWKDGHAVSSFTYQSAGLDDEEPDSVWYAIDKTGSSHGNDVRIGIRAPNQ